MACVRVEEDGDRLIVTCLLEKLVADMVIEEFAREVFAAIEAAISRGRKTLVLELTTVETMGSATLGKLIVANKRLKKAGLTLEMRGLQPAVRDLMTLCGSARRIDSDADPSDIPPASFDVSPELFEFRAEVLAALQEKGYSWMVDFTSVEPLHNVFGIEVRGIKSEAEAMAIQRLMLSMYPTWSGMCLWYRDGREPGWRAAIRREG